MPKKPKVGCKKLGCPELVDFGLCPVHYREKMQEKDKKRGSAASRGYDGEWRKIRERILNLIPFCTFPNCFYFATQLDHIDGNQANNNTNNLRPYCDDCHRKKTLAVDVKSRNQITWQQWETDNPLTLKGKVK
jgi:5-methylcytosine-specific restriction protein A